LFISFLCSILLIGCYSKIVESSKDIPIEWQNNNWYPPANSDYIYGFGNGISTDELLAIEKAKTAAKTVISLSIMECKYAFVRRIIKTLACKVQS